MAQELPADPEYERDVTLAVVQFLGIDRTDYLALLPEGRAIGGFTSAWQGIPRQT